MTCSFDVGHGRAALAASIFALALAAPIQAHAAVALLTVGDDVDCDFRTSTSANALQDAIDAVPASVPPGDLYVIRVARSGDYLGTLLDASGRDFLMEGGYASCASVAADSTNTTIDADGANGVVLRVFNTGSRRQLEFANLTLRGAAGNAAKGLSIEGADVVLRRVTVEDNLGGVSGGGLIIDGDPPGASLQLVGGTAVVDNVATGNGGGLYCSRGARLELHSASAVAGNEAVLGGGIYIDGCSGFINSGALGLAGLFVNVGNNSAGFGGGLYVDSGSGPADIVIGEGLGRDDPRPVFLLNEATTQGGGIMAAGSDTRLTLRNALLVSNSSGSTGGGIQVRNGPQVVIERTLPRCGINGECSEILDNDAALGGAIALAGEGTEVTVRGTRISGNSAFSDGSAVFNQAGQSSIRLESVLVVDNTGPTVIDASDPLSFTPRATTTTIVGSTIADNPGASVAIQLNDEGQATLQLSIVREAAGVDAFGYGTANPPDTLCSLLHETASLDAPGPGVIATANPGFVDAPGGDYRLQREANGVDRCGPEPGYPAVDLLLNPRPYDVANFPDIAGSYDVGAYEHDEGVFADGFESGG